MKLKREQISFMNLTKVFKGLLFFSALLLANLVYGQEVSIVSLDADAAEVMAPGAQNAASFTIFRNVNSPLATVVNYEVTGTANSGTDHNLGDGSVNLNFLTPGSAITTDISITDDLLVEDVIETIVITLTTVLNGTISATQNSVTINITDNDDDAVVFLDTASANFIATVNEDGTLQMPAEFGQFRPVIDKANGTSAPLTVTYQITGSADNGLDYNLTNAVVLTFTNNELSRARNIRVAPIEDIDPESNETVTLRLISTSSSSYSIGTPATATITIVDNDCIAGTTAPVLNANATEFCGAFSVALDSYFDGVLPAGVDLVWSTNPNPTVTGAWLLPGAGNTINTPDTYYAFFADTVENCYSPITTQVITQNFEPSAGTPINNIPDACNNADAAFTPRTLDLDLLIAGEDAGNWSQTGGPSVGLIPNSNVINFDNRAAGDYEFTFTTTGALGACTNQSTAITITVIDCDQCAGLTAPVLDNEPTAFCDVPGVNLNTFYSGPTTAGIPLRWSLIPNPTLTTQLLTGTAVTTATSNTYYAVFWSNAGACAGPASNPLVITLNDSPSAGTEINNIPVACNNADDAFTPRTLDLDLMITGEDTGNWAQTGGPSVGPIPNSNVINFDNRAAGDYDFTFTTTGAVAPCVNESITITITVEDCDPCVAGNNAPVLSPGAPDTVYCRDAEDNEMISLDLNDFTNTNPPPDTELRWSTISNLENENAHLTSSSISISTGATYRGFFWDDVNKCASPPLLIALLIKPIPVLTVGENQERCGEGSVTFTAAATLNATINWYASETGDTILSSGSNFITPSISTTTTFFVEATLNDCASERQQVIATVQQQPSAGTAQNNGNASACSIAANGPTILDLDDLIAGEDVGAWAYTSGPFAEFDIPSNNILNFEGRPDGEYVFTYTTTGAMAPCENASTVMTITINDCDVDTDLDGLFDGPEATLGTDPTNPDTDGDGVNDAEEVGADIENPLDEDADGIIDALDSNIIDSDMDGVVDQIDPANDNPCIPDNTNGLCDTDGDGITDGVEIANGTNPLDPCDPNLDSDACVDPVPIDLEIQKDVDNINALFEEEVTFTITLINLADSKVKAVKVGELIESGFEYISHEASIGTYDVQSGAWDIFEIGPLSTHTLTILVKVIEGGMYSNTAELLESFPIDNNPDNDIATVTLPIELPEGIDLILEKTALSANPLINEEVIFTIKVINASIDVNPVNNIEVRDVLDADNFEYIDHNTVAGEYDEVSGVWSIPTLAREQEAILEIRVRVPNEGVFMNTAAIIRSSPVDGNPENNEATAEVTVSLPTPADVGFLFNQFSPNGDGTNDVLKINRLNSESNQEVEVRYNIQIFNRYGNLVFEANSKSESEVWDGSWKGKDAPNGTYFYTMNLDIGDGEGPKIKKGWIQLIR